MLPRLPVYEGGALSQKPYIPAVQIKSKIRHGVNLVVLDRVKAAEEKITFEDHLLGAEGGVKGSEKETITPDKRAAVIRASGILSLFGAGASPAGRMCGGAISVAHAVPQDDVETAMIAGVRAHENQSPDLLEILGPDEFERVGLYTKVNNSRSELRKEKLEAEKAVKDAKRKKLSDAETTVLENELAEIEKRVNEETEARAKLGFGDVSLGMPLPGYEVIPEGTALNHQIGLNLQPMHHIGLLLAGMEEFALGPRASDGEQTPFRPPSGCPPVEWLRTFRRPVRRDHERGPSWALAPRRACHPWR